MLVGECDMCTLLEHIFHSSNLLVYIKNTLDLCGPLLHMSYEETPIFLKVGLSVTMSLYHSFGLLVLRVWSSSNVVPIVHLMCPCLFIRDRISNRQPFGSIQFC